MSWDDLSNDYRRRGIFIAVGAGISLGCKLPTWSELLRRVALASLGQGGDAQVDDLIQRGFSLPWIANLLRVNCRTFVETVRDNLYQDFPFYRRALSSVDGQKLVEFVKSENATMRALGAFCAIRKPDGNDGKFERNPRVHAIFNFNLDAVFRAYMRYRYKPLLVRTIERASKSPRLHKLSVYHVHGHLRFDREATNPSKEGADRLVFTEEQYFDAYSNQLGIFTYTFLHMLREYSCVFIGLSMHDENIRRLLHYSRKERIEAYQEEKLSLPEARKKSLRHYAVMLRTWVGDVDRATEQSLSELGTNVLWINGYEELPKCLAEVYGSTGDNWATVY